MPKIPSSRNAHSTAQRGDLFVYEVMHSCTYLKGGTEQTYEYLLGQVAGVSRDGLVSSYSDRQGYKHRGRPARLWLVSANRFADPAAVVRSSESFTSLDQARAWLRDRALPLTPSPSGDEVAKPARPLRSLSTAQHSR